MDSQFSLLKEELTPCYAKLSGATVIQFLVSFNSTQTR